MGHLDAQGYYHRDPGEPPATSRLAARALGYPGAWLDADVGVPVYVHERARPIAHLRTTPTDTACTCGHPARVHTTRPGAGCTSSGCLCLETPALVNAQAALLAAPSTGPALRRRWWRIRAG